MIFVKLSALQKAISRGHIGQVKNLMPDLWKRHPEALKWRLPIITLDEAWYMMGEYPFSKDASYDDYFKYVCRLCACYKNKDIAIGSHAKNSRIGIASKSEEFKLLSELSKYQSIGESYRDSVKKISDWCLSNYDFESHEMDVLDYFTNRVYNSSCRDTDFRKISTALIFLCTRGISKIDISRSLNESKKCIKKEDMRSTGIQWYVYDMSTTVGVNSIGIFNSEYLREYKITKSDFVDLLTNIEWSKTPANRFKTDNTAGCVRTVWWPHIQRLSIKKAYPNVRGLKNVWPDIVKKYSMVVSNIAKEEKYASY